MESTEARSREFDQPKHPELQEGEMWLTNSSKNGAEIVGYTSRRVGEKAYSMSGEEVPGLHPVFVSKEEYAKKMGM